MLADNPIAYWRLGETSGSTAADASGNGRNGTYLNGVALGGNGALVGDSDTSARFDGVDDSVQVPDDAALRLNGSWSIEFWARQIAFANTWPGILYKGDAQTKNGYIIWANSGGELWFKRENKENGSGPGALTPVFRHFVITYDGSILRWYVDGALTTTKNVGFPANNGTTSLELGKGDDFGNNDLDEVAFYDTALSAARIAAHYSAGT